MTTNSGIYMVKNANFSAFLLTIGDLRDRL